MSPRVAGVLILAGILAAVLGVVGLLGGFEAVMVVLLCLAVPLVLWWLVALAGYAIDLIDYNNWG